jgi:hypothetical protein
MMETLTNASFRNLTKTEQVVMIINSGEELMVREEEGYIIHLYLLSGLFVEVWFESDTKKIVNVESTDKENITKNYLEMNELVKQLLKDK